MTPDSLSRAERVSIEALSLAFQYARLIPIVPPNLPGCFAIAEDIEKWLQRPRPAQIP